MKAELKIFSTPTADTPGSSFILQFDKRRYIFGHVAEGTQRSTVEQQIRMKTVQDFFITGKTEWRTVGGLIGMLLTIIDQEGNRLLCLSNANMEKELKAAGVAASKTMSGTELRDHMLKVAAKLNSQAVVENVDDARRKITLHGADNLAHTIGTARYFVFRNRLPVEVDEMEQVYEDEFLKVFPLRLVPSTVSDASSTPSGSTEGVSKKRSFEMTLGNDPTSDARKQTLKKVVQNMFASTWTMDSKVDDVVDVEDDIPGSESPAKVARIEGPWDSSGQPQIMEPVSDRAPWPASRLQRLPDSKPSPTSMSYIVRLHPQRGKFLPEVAIRLGVMPGRDFSKIVKGEHVVGKNGNVVRREDCLEPTKPGGAFAFLELPDATYIDDLISREEWKDKNLIANCNIVFWMAPPEVMNDPRIMEFMKSFLPITQHVVSSPEACPNDLAFKAVAKQVAKLNLLDGAIYPIPHFDKASKESEGVDKPYKIAEARQLYRILPEFEEVPLVKEEFTGVVAPEADPEAYMAYLEYLRLAKEANETIKSQYPEDELEDIEGKDTEVITLGTGSALPSKYRNVSSTMIRRPDGTSLLFDAGENTIGQLARVFAPDELREAYMKLRAVYISHLHADHHLGTASVLKQWYKTRHNCVPNPDFDEVELVSQTQPYRGADGTPDYRYIYVIAPAKYSLWLREYSCVEDIGLSWIRFLPCETYIDATGMSENPAIADRLAQVYNEIGLSRIDFRPAHHCPMAFVTSLTYKDGLKVSYSGDTTAPHNSFAEIGKDTTILIHEATFDDELIKEAAAKRHSTTSQAIEQGRRMNAKHVILTHFSQRYPKIPELQNLEQHTVAVAFDLMRVKIGHLRKMKVFLPALQALYAGDKDDDDMTLEEKENAARQKQEAAQKRHAEKLAKAAKNPQKKKDPLSEGHKKLKHKEMLRMAQAVQQEEEAKKKEQEEESKKMEQEGEVI